MIYNFNPTPPANNADNVIAVDLTGIVYTEKNQLHIKDAQTHYVYKFDGTPTGWHIRNKKGQDIFLGAGACPTANFEGLSIVNEAYWQSIVYVGDSPVFGADATF